MQDRPRPGLLDRQWHRHIHIPIDDLNHWQTDHSAASARAACRATSATNRASSLSVYNAKEWEILDGDHVGSLILPGERDIFAISRHGWLYHQPIAGLDRVDDGIEQAHSPAVKKVIPLRGDRRSTQANENDAGKYIDFSHGESPVVLR